MNDSSNEHNILLSSGTNEVELLEFVLGEQQFGINVAKIQQIIPFEASKLTAIPKAAESIIGVVSWKDKPTNVIDLNVILQMEEKRSSWPVVILTNFNGMVSGFLVDEIKGIHRVSWGKIQPLNKVLKGSASYVTGSIQLENEEVMLIDFEHIVSEIFPDTKIKLETDSFTQEIIEKRAKVKVIFAEDSPFIRKSMTDFLKKAGFEVDEFENGEVAFEHIVKVQNNALAKGQPLKELVDVIITDIEMPQMDGLTLCKKIRNELKIEDTPIIIFSSLINEQMAHKCKSVGASGYITKPKSHDLARMIDEFLKL